MASTTLGAIAVMPTSNGIVNVQGTDSQWRISDSLSVGGGLNIAGGSGALNIDTNGRVKVDYDLRIWDTGTVNLTGGELQATTIDHTYGGAFSFIAGALAVNTFQGDLTQDGGTLSPGASPGTTHITGDYALNAGVIETEFGGAGNPIDLVDVTGDVSIALVGTTLDLRPLGTMAAGTYTLLETTGGTLTGEFENVTDLGVYDDLFGVQYTATSVTLTLDMDLIAGDFDLDGDVDGFDFLKWQRGESYSPYSASDLADWEANYGVKASLLAASVTVPEPNSLVLLGLGVLLLVYRPDS